ncbi:hypothetical protein ANCCAN_12212 [Ancylostoma caninum]|uniref:Uncharacterized protein n=1 Tax=Ancylostoma caninum TaxID=29170 RepID=A0A368GBR2_ANCCA|nr:hypothetical protein ANCCAN_12212 [Ancylostoma caninum]
MDSRSLTSRMNLTAIPNVSRCSEVVLVKEEPGESPPPDALPSPPQFDQTVLGQNSANEGRIAGDKERDEFWALGIAEHKKGHQILEARAKIERLQKELFETTSYLQKSFCHILGVRKMSVYGPHPHLNQTGSGYERDSSQKIRTSWVTRSKCYVEVMCVRPFLLCAR